MMSEKRFMIGDENTVMLLKRVILMNDGRFEVDVDHLLRVWDTESNKRLTVEEVVDLLNEQQELIEEKSNVIILMGAFIKSKGFSVNDFDEWVSEDWHIGDEKYKMR